MSVKHFELLPFLTSRLLELTSGPEIDDTVQCLEGILSVPSSVKLCTPTSCMLLKVDILMYSQLHSRFTSAAMSASTLLPFVAKGPRHTPPSPTVSRALPTSPMSIASFWEPLPPLPLRPILWARHLILPVLYLGLEV